jgi:tRNA-dihydrouridine synthase B
VNQSVTNESFRIGPHAIHGRAVLAPMAGLTDQVFRNLCRNFGAALAISEMNTADKRLWNSEKSRTRLHLAGENGLKIVQIAGSEPAMLADAALGAEQLGADIVDINMGCPAKKVCRKLSGSALLQDEGLVREILQAVVSATKLPVTLKMRTGWNPDNRNGVAIAKIAESAGIKALSVHGRTRACMFKGAVEFDTIREIKQSVSVPVIANGDIDSVQTARKVLKLTQADAVMIGRGALGQPWVFSALRQLAESTNLSAPAHDRSIDLDLRRDTILSHLNAVHGLYGEDRGVRVARKHLSWYCKYLGGTERYWQEVARADSATDQLQITKNFFEFNDNQTGVDRDVGLSMSNACATQNKYASIKTQNQRQTLREKAHASGPESQSTS